MNLEGFWWLPIIVAITLISAGIYIAQWDVDDDDVNSYISKSNDMEEQTNNVRDVFESKTTEKGLSGIIEDLPIFGDLAKVMKFLTAIIGTLRSGVDLMIGFFSDVLSSEVLGIDSRIIALILAGFFGAFGFAVFKAIKGN